MATPDSHLGFVLVFFIYGLAFFSMGIALILETLRSPLLDERRFILPLAVFGLLHGMHEWMEIIILQGVWLDQPFPAAFSTLRVVWLSVSFVPLIVFSAQVLPSPQARYPLYVGVGLILLFLGSVIFFAGTDKQQMVARADVLARYFLAIPGGMLAGLALLSRSRKLKSEQRDPLGKRFQYSALGFVIYGITQIFVNATGIFPSNFINAGLFLSLFGVPVQVIRAAMAVFITVNFILAIQVVERERQRQLLDAQKSRLDALEQIRQDLIEREVLRRELLQHIVIAQEDERSRIARELHDDTAQLLTAFRLNLSTLQDALPDDPRFTQLLSRLQALSRQMSQGIYRLVHDLRPAQLDDLGLVAALQYLADEERKRAGLDVSLKITGSRQRLDSLVETVLFRVAQEALTNVARHANVKTAEIHLVFDPGGTSLQVLDHGAGFDLQKELRPPHGWGLAGMRERAESIGAKFNLDSSPGKGTVVEIIAPPPVFRSNPKENAHVSHPFNVS